MVEIRNGARLGILENYPILKKLSVLGNMHQKLIVRGTDVSKIHTSPTNIFMIEKCIVL